MVLVYNKTVYMRKFVVLLLFSIVTNTSCSLVDPITKAQNLIQKGKFDQAIIILEKEYKKEPNSVPVKSILAQTYSDYGLVLCQDTNKPPTVKYPMAKEQFAMALALNPYLKDAKDMYETIEQIQASFEANKIE